MASRRGTAYDAIEAVLRDGSPELNSALTALGGVPALRSDLDALERATIDAARRAGASWNDVAAALGVGSRQAAEQRRLRLGGIPRGESAPSATSAARIRRRRQRDVDAWAGEAVIALRSVVFDLGICLDDSTAEPATEATIRLARSTLRIAAAAEPGALVDLARLSLADLAAAELSPLAAELTERLREAIRAASTRPPATVDG